MCLFSLIAALLTPRALLLIGFFFTDHVHEGLARYEGEYFEGFTVVATLVGVLLLPSTVCALVMLNLFTPGPWETWKTIAMVAAVIVDLGMLQQSKRERE